MFHHIVIWSIRTIFQFHHASSLKLLQSQVQISHGEGALEQAHPTSEKPECPSSFICSNARQTRRDAGSSGRPPPVGPGVLAGPGN